MYKSFKTLAIALLLLASTTLQADAKHGNKYRQYQRWNNGYNQQYYGQNRYWNNSYDNRSNNGHDNGRHRGWNNR